MLRWMSSLAAILDDADAFFMGRGKLHEAAARIGGILDAMGVPYAIAGALALAVHGRRRLTEDVDILLTRADLARFKAEWLGRGYLDVTPGLKAVRDTAAGVKIDFLLVGDFPGDGRPKPVAFPVPPTDCVQADGYRVLPLERLVELKLASGMTAPHRGQDLVDVMELIRARDLPREFADRLDAYVRAEYDRQWGLARIREDY
jgi:hypothetical protein